MAIEERLVPGAFVVRIDLRSCVIDQCTNQSVSAVFVPAAAMLKESIHENEEKAENEFPSSAVARTARTASRRRTAACISRGQGRPMVNGGADLSEHSKGRIADCSSLKESVSGSRDGLAGRWFGEHPRLG